MNEKLKINRGMLLSGLFISSMLAQAQSTSSTGNQTENLESVRNRPGALQSLNEAGR
jgi:hypothetical protein